MMQQQESQAKSLSELIKEAKNEIVAAADLISLDHLRVKYLGKKGQLTELLKSVSSLPVAERPQAGKDINIAKRELQTWIAEQEERLQDKDLIDQLTKESVDITLPGRGEQLGGRHPISRVRERVIELFSGMGFTVAEGPEIEDEEHNFAALNIPVHHPARAAQDTFYCQGGMLLRTHTSPVQIREMKKQGAPIRIITPGRVFRRDSDMTHTPMFHQLEGLFVDKHCTFADLKATLQTFFNRFYEADVKLRFRPSYFPFTEPSAEVDLQRIIKTDQGEQHTWLEVLGCGMVHPNVLRHVGIDPDEYSGYAFGIGLDRLAMMRYGIKDLRMMFENDWRFLEQF